MRIRTGKRRKGKKITVEKEIRHFRKQIEANEA